MTKIDFIEDFDREGPSVLKVIQLFKLFFPHNTKTLARIDRFSDLDILKLNRLSNLNIKGLIIDSDDCISYNHGDILPENIKHIKKLYEQGIKMVIYSNMKKSKRYEPIEKYAKVLTHIPPKPSKKGFKKALSTLGLTSEDVAMVGDNYITDGGSIKVGIPFIKVKPIRTVTEDKILGEALKIYGILREFYEKISLLHDKAHARKPITSKDLK